jgi:hypothetical protein
MMTHDEMIAVILHHKNGGKVQHTGKHPSLRWHDMLDGQEPSWDFSCLNYRAKPEPLVLWLDVRFDDTVAADGLTPFVTISGKPVRKFVEVME